MTRMIDDIKEWFAFFGIAVIVLLVIAILSSVAFARDTTGLSDSLTQDQREWVKGLRDKGGTPCCDDADGIDPVWEIKDGQYRVFWEQRWLVVSKDALLTQPNKIGVARAWMAYGDGEMYVRCFLPGPVS